MRPAAWALLAVQQHVGLSFHVGRVLPPRADVRESYSSGRIGQVMLGGGSRGSMSHFTIHTKYAASQTALMGCCSRDARRTAQRHSSHLIGCSCPVSVGLLGRLGSIGPIHSDEETRVVALCIYHPILQVVLRLVRSALLVLVMCVAGLRAACGRCYPRLAMALMDVIRVHPRSTLRGHTSNVLVLEI